MLTNRSGGGRIPSRKFARHSFRIRVVTMVGRCGIRESLIETLGQWESSAYMHYMSTSPETLWSMSRILVVSPKVWSDTDTGTVASCSLADRVVG